MDPETFDPQVTYDPGFGGPMPSDALFLFVWDEDLGLWNRARSSDLSPPLAKRIALMTSKGWLQEGVNGEAVG